MKSRMLRSSWITCSTNSSSPGAWSAGFRVAQHAPYLRGQDLRVAQGAGVSRSPQALVRHAGPQEVRQPRRKLVLGPEHQRQAVAEWLARELARIDRGLRLLVRRHFPVAQLQHDLVPAIAILDQRRHRREGFEVQIMYVLFVAVAGETIPARNGLTTASNPAADALLRIGRG
jgi:hypothetical protein